MPQLRTRLDEHQPVLLRLLLALLRRDLPLVVEIRLVTDQRDDDVVPSLITHVVYPFARVLERLCVRDVVYHHRHVRVLDIRRYQGAEPFLACRVP